MKSTHKIYLSGIDYFQLLIDKHARKKGGRGHDSRLLIALKGVFPPYELKTHFENHLLTRQLFAMRLTTHFDIGFPAWKYDPEYAKVTLNIHPTPLDKVPSDAFQAIVDPYTGPPLCISVYYTTDNSTVLLFTANHILFDFNALQSYIFSLAGKGPELEIKNILDKKLIKRSRHLFFQAISMVFGNRLNKMTAPNLVKTDTAPVKLDFDHVCYTIDQTEKIKRNIEASSLSVMPSVYFAAGVSKTMNDVLFDLYDKEAFFWIPLPVNTRPPVDSKPTLGNRLTFVFLKLKKENLGTMQEALTEIKKQFFSRLKSKSNLAFTEFAEIYKYMPLKIYYPMFLLPSLGKMASFSFSVLGETFCGLDTLFGRKITQIINYPSNTIQPGITVLFYWHDGRLNITTSWIKGQFSRAEHKMVMDKIENVLLDSAINSTPNS